MAGRTFSMLKESMSLEKLNGFCYIVANAYARARDKEYEFFMREYNISESCLNRILDYAVCKYIVSDWTVDKMKEKDERNRRETRNKYHYEKLQRKRRTFAIDMAKDFIANRNKPIEFFMKKYGRSKQRLKYTLEKLIFKPSYYKISKEGITILNDFIEKLKAGSKE